MNDLLFIFPSMRGNRVFGKRSIASGGIFILRIAVFLKEDSVLGFTQKCPQEEAEMEAGRKSCGYAHDQAKVNIFGILPARGILECLNRPVGVFVSSFDKLLGDVFPETDQPTSERENEEHPKGRENPDDQIEGEVQDIFRSSNGGEGPSNNP